MLADQRQLVLGQRKLPDNVFDEVVGGDCCQVPLQLPEDYQLPFLKRRGGGSGTDREGKRGSRNCRLMLLRSY